MNDLVSVIIPAYNASEYLGEAIDSALAQTYRNVEIIVINDGSTDDGLTKDVAQRYGDKIKYYEKKNGGCASALNYGIQVMNGKWFSWLSHDDLYFPRKIESLLSLIDEYKIASDSVVLGCNDVLLNSNGRYLNNIFQNSSGILSPTVAFGETLNKKTFNGCGLLIPRTILDRVGSFDIEYKHLLDRELWMRIAINGFSFVYTDEKLVVSRVHDNQVTIKDRDLLFKEEMKLIEDYREKLNGYDIRYLQELAFFCYKRKHYRQGKIIIDDLKKNGAYRFNTRKKIYYYTISGWIKAAGRDTYKKYLRSI